MRLRRGTAQGDPAHARRSSQPAVLIGATDVEDRVFAVASQRAGVCGTFSTAQRMASGPVSDGAI